MTTETRQILNKQASEDRAKMLAGLMQPRQEVFVVRGDVDWRLYDRAKSAYETRH